MEPPLELPELPPNAELLGFLRQQASRPAGSDDYTLGSWQLHTHPDLLSRLRELAPGWPLTAAYGVPLLACQGIAAVAALGTSWLAVRIASLPPHVEAPDPAPRWPFVHGDWHLISPWPDHQTRADSVRTLRALVSAALEYAATLA